MARKMRSPEISEERLKILEKLSDEVREEVVRRHGNELSYEERRDAALKIMTEVLWVDERKDLENLKTDAAEIEIARLRAQLAKLGGQS